MSYINSRVFCPHDFAVPEEAFMRLNTPRSFGLSGHLRVRNEAVTLRACLDSCLPFLDELIVTYNDSSDDTEAILHEYAQRYPQKIRLFWYPLEWGTIRGVSRARPLGHLAQFYNFGYTKVRYAYYMKIDGDQIYFTEKMLFIKAMLYKYSRPNLGPEHIPPMQQGHSNTYAYCERNIAKALIGPKKYTLILGGLNICYCKDELYVYTSNNLDRRALFNGFFGDTFIVSPSFSQRYFLHGDYMEIFPHVHSQCISLGLAWVHASMVKQNVHFQQGQAIALREAQYISWAQAYEQINTAPTQDKKMHNVYKNLGRQFWDRDIPTFVTDAFYEAYFADVLTRVRTYFQEKEKREL